MPHCAFPQVCPDLRGFSHLLYLDRTLDVGKPLRAGTMHSFGFGQAGAELLVLHPDHVFAAVSQGGVSAGSVRLSRAYPCL